MKRISIATISIEEAVYFAIQNGYHLIDTARYYSNEAGVGRAVRRAIDDNIVKREELFITSKILPTRNVKDAEYEIDASLAALGLDYIDLMLIHQPGFNDQETYKALERAVKAGKLRSIGISNYYTPEEFERINRIAEITPAVIQNENEDGEKRLSIRAGEALYGVDRAKLDVVNRIMQNDDNKIVSFEAATALKKACRENPDITDEEIKQIITGNAPAKPDGINDEERADESAGRKRRFSLASDSGLTKAINKYCHNMSDQQIDDLLSDLLTKWGDSAESTAESTENTQSE